VASVLKETLYATGTATRTLVVDIESVDAPDTQTATQTHDGNDTYYDTVRANGGDSTAAGSLRVEWTLDALSYAGTIDSVKVYTRGRRTAAQNDQYFRPSINGVDRGTNHSATFSFVTQSDTFTTDPADSAAWTAAKLAAQKMGYLLAVSSEDGEEVVVYASEFKVEVWGPEAPAAQSTVVSASGSGATDVVESSKVGTVDGAMGVGACAVVFSGSGALAIAASGASGAGCNSISVYFNPPRSVDFMSFTDPALDGVTGLPTTAWDTIQDIGQKNVRSLGKPHFAFALAEALPIFAPGSEAAAYVVFALHALPAMVASWDEVHWLFSFHEEADQSLEILSIGVTPGGALVAATLEAGIIRSSAGVVSADGNFHEARIDLRAPGTWRDLSLDGRVLVSVVGSITPLYDPPDNVAVRASLFNGRDGLSRLNASIAKAGLAFEDFSLDWPIEEGAGEILGYTSETEAIEFPLYTPPWPLAATWFSGLPVSVCPDDPTLPLSSAYTWGRSTRWTPRPPHKPEYRKVVSA
jgi:hypothetical protein